MRVSPQVVQGLDVKQHLGSVDPRTGIYHSTGPPLSVEMQLSEGVNICGCPPVDPAGGGGGPDGDMLLFKATLTLMLSADRHMQGRPLEQQPVVALRNADGRSETYIIHIFHTLAP